VTAGASGVDRECWSLFQFSVMYPIGKPRLHLLDAGIARLRGDTAGARQASERARKAAERLAMPCEITLSERYHS
jgi:hypothetical protein